MAEHAFISPKAYERIADLVIERLVRDYKYTIPQEEG